MNRTTKSRKTQNARRKRNLQILRNIESGHFKTAEMKEKLKSMLRRTRKQLETKLRSKNLTKGINEWLTFL